MHDDQAASPAPHPWPPLLVDGRPDAAGDARAAAFVEAWDAHEARTVDLERRRRRGTARRLAREAAQTVLLALVIYFGTFTMVQGRQVEGPSMQPAYHAGERLFVNRAVYARVNMSWLSRILPFVSPPSEPAYLFHAPRRGEVIVFRPPFRSPDELIKRVIGVPGDRVVVKDGRVTVNGRELAQPAPLAWSTACAGRWCDTVLGADEYYVMGDNRGNSSDSRFWGPVKAGRIVGKAWLIVHPFRDFGFAR